jgi:LacI family transcriptional regulator
MLGMVVPEVSNPYFADLMGAIEECCRARGLAVLFGASANDPAREFDYVREFRERQVDGMLLVGAQETKRIEALLPSGYPVVAVDRIPAGWSRDLVAVDVRAGVELAVGHLVSLGHERLAFLGGQSAIGVAASRRDQFLRACRERGATVTAVSEGEFTLASGLLQADEILSAPDRPTALVAANDLLALGAIGSAQQRGFRVPEDLCVVGFDDSSIAAAVSPELTTIRQPVEQIATEAVAAVLSRIESPRRLRVAKWLPPELVVRNSTASKI